VRVANESRPSRRAEGINRRANCCLGVRCRTGGRGSLSEKGARERRSKKRKNRFLAQSGKDETQLCRVQTNVNPSSYGGVLCRSKTRLSHVESWGGKAGGTDWSHRESSTASTGRGKAGRGTVNMRDIFHVCVASGPEWKGGEGSGTLSGAWSDRFEEGQKWGPQNSPESTRWENQLKKDEINFGNQEPGVADNDRKNLL